MVFGKLFDMADNRFVRKIGVTPGDAWHDPELDAALPAVQGGDIAAGLALLDTPDPQSRSLRLHVLSEKTGHLLPVLESGMDQPDPEPDLLLWAGAARVRAAWEVRTGGWARDVGRERMERFQDMLLSARDTLLHAARTSLTPTAWDQLQWYGLGMNLPREEMDHIWERIVELDPGHHAAHESRLQVLCAKWQGSHEEMFAFARETVARAAPGDRSLALIARAHSENLTVLIDSEGLETYGRVRELLTGYYTDPSVRSEIVGAADHWMAGGPAYPTAPADAHTLGSSLYACGERARAAGILRLAGTRVPEGPSNLWQLLGSNPAAFYARTRQELYVPLPAVRTAPARSAVDGSGR